MSHARYKGAHREKMEVGFAGSRDGIAWQRYDRAAYGSPGTASPDMMNMVFMGNSLVVRADESWQYGTEFEREHGDVAARGREQDGAIVRYVQRVDGIVAATAGNREGVLRTSLVCVTGGRLLLDLDSGSLGEARVGLLDQT